MPAITRAEIEGHIKNTADLVERIFVRSRVVDALVGGRWNKTPEAVPPGAGVAVMPDFQFGGHKVEVYFNDVHDEPKTIDVHLDLLAQTDEAFDNWCKVRRESIAAEKAESRRKNDAVEREIFERLKAKFEPKQETPNGGGEDREP